MAADAIARVLAEPRIHYVYSADGPTLIRCYLKDIPAADRLAQRERHAALAREIGRGLEPGEAIARAILEDRANG